MTNVSNGAAAREAFGKMLDDPAFREYVERHYMAEWTVEEREHGPVLQVKVTVDGHHLFDDSMLMKKIEL